MHGVISNRGLPQVTSLEMMMWGNSVSLCTDLPCESCVVAVSGRNYTEKMHTNPCPTRQLQNFWFTHSSIFDLLDGNTSPTLNGKQCASERPPFKSVGCINRRGFIQPALRPPQRFETLVSFSLTQNDFSGVDTEVAALVSTAKVLTSSPDT